MLLALLSSAAAGPWVKDPGQWYVKANAATFTANQYIDPLVQSDAGGTTIAKYAFTMPVSYLDARRNGVLSTP